MNSRIVRRTWLMAGVLAAMFTTIGGYLLAVPEWGRGSSYQIVAVHPHDPNAFTQGLLFHDGKLYESTGRNGQSSLRRVDPETGRVEKLVRLKQEYFAEGLALLNGKLYQLTWDSGRAFVYDVDTMEYERTLAYRGEGWGLTTDGTYLILSEGSSTLRFYDPATFREVKRLSVRENGWPVRKLNELEYVDGEIWANIWHSDRVVRIDPDDGDVVGSINLAGLLKPGEQRHREAVLNGIAYDPATGRVFVTGKDWPKLFEMRVAGVGPGR